MYRLAPVSVRHHVLLALRFDATADVLWTVLPANDVNSTTTLFGIDTVGGTVLHRLNVFTPLSGPAAFAFDQKLGRIVGRRVRNGRTVEEREPTA